MPRWPFWLLDSTLLKFQRSKSKLAWACRPPCISSIILERDYLVVVCIFVQFSFNFAKFDTKAPGRLRHYNWGHGFLWLTIEFTLFSSNLYSFFVERASSTSKKYHQPKLSFHLSYSLSSIPRSVAPLAVILKNLVCFFWKVQFQEGFCKFVGAMVCRGFTNWVEVIFLVWNKSYTMVKWVLYGSTK